MSSNPYPPPPVNVLAQMLLVHAWAEHLDDDTRLMLEWAGKALKAQHKQNVRLAKTLEVTEAKHANG